MCLILPTLTNLKTSQPKEEMTKLKVSFIIIIIIIYHQSNINKYFINCSNWSKIALHVKQEMTKKKNKLPIIIKKKTISNLHTNASNAKKLSMMHLLRLPTNRGRQKRKRNI